jgi:hypothetical protein
MISKKEYDKIAGKWKGKVYQKYKKLVEKRLPIIEKNIDFFKGAKVLELGLNAGMYAWHLHSYVLKYTGIEVDKHYCKQARTALFGTKVGVVNKSFEDVNLNDFDFDLFLASYVLHHLNICEVQKLNNVFNRCNKIAIHTRSGDPLRYGHDEIGCDPLKWWKGSMIKLMLERHDFGIDFQLNKEGIFDGNYLILAEKK